VRSLQYAVSAQIAEANGLSAPAEVVKSDLGDELAVLRHQTRCGRVGAVSDFTPLPLHLAPGNFFRGSIGLGGVRNS
jgi:hypothetical protein